MTERTCGTCRWWTADDLNPEISGACRYAVRSPDDVDPPGPWMWAYADGRYCAELEYGLLTSPDFSCARWEGEP